MSHIISVSRRTDIPAYYTPWFMNRVRAGFCLVPNPYDLTRVTRVSLLPEDVQCLAFWTRNPSPLLHHIDELEDRGLPFFFQVTLTGYLPPLEKLPAPCATALGAAAPANLPGTQISRDATDSGTGLAHPPARDAVHAIRRLGDRIGPARVVWRYDPIVLSDLTPEHWHLHNFGQLCQALEGSVHHVVSSFVEPYPAVRERFRKLNAHGANISLPGEHAKRELIEALADIAAQHGLALQTCCTPATADTHGMPCIGPAMIHAATGLMPAEMRDPNQRQNCRCLPSIDIGVYATCPRGCIYCYANNTPSTQIAHATQHDPTSPSLMPIMHSADTATHKEPM